MQTAATPGNQKMKLVIYISLALFIGVNNFAAADDGLDQARRIVTAALPFVQSGGMAWRTDQDCASCHTTTFTTWAFNRADEVGLDVDAERLADWRGWSGNWKNLVNPKRKDTTTREQALLGECDTVGQLILGRPAAVNDADAEWLDVLRTHLLKAQTENGSWKAGGQLPLQKRPARETNEVTTMWSVLALKSLPESEATSAAIKKAQAWLNRPIEARSTEWLAAKLLLQEADSAKTRAALLKQQHEDGSWGWLQADPGDALGTSQAVYSLLKSGMTVNDEPIVRAIAWLEETQSSDGSWSVPGTKRTAEGEITDTASYWGTCWAVIALTEAIEPS